MTDLANLSLVEAAEAISSKQASAVEVLQACLSELDAHGAAVNATTWVDRDGALQAARAGDAATGTRGKLHGLPLAHKDMYYQAGRLSTCGSKIRGAFRPDYTATVIDRMAAEGAYSFAGLNMAEFAMNGTGHNRHFGHCNNPWRLPYITGGSSSGSGAAVAARFTYAALGSDTGGSIRLPAAANGVSGIKPTQTRVSRYGVMPLSFSADNVGPLARTARDCARVLSVIAGYDPMDPTSAQVAVPDYEAGLDGDLRGLKIGVPTSYFLDGADAHVQAAFDTAMAVLVGRGAEIVPITLPLMPEILTYGSVLSRVDSAAIHAQLMRDYPQDYAIHINARMFASYAVPGVYYVEAQSRRGPVLKAFAQDVFSRVHVLASPTIKVCLPTLAETDVDAGAPDAMAKSTAVVGNTRPFNYLGLPVVSVPCGFDPSGLPISLSFAAKPFAEAMALKVGDAYQRETDWHSQRPTFRQ